MEADFVNFALRASNYSIPGAPLYFYDYKNIQVYLQMKV